MTVKLCKLNTTLQGIKSTALYKLEDELAFELNLIALTADLLKAHSRT